jgi:hypothetical protein
MSTLDGVIGLDFYLVQKHLKRLRALDTLQLRRVYLVGVLREDGERVHELTQKAFAEWWAQRDQQQEGACAST